MTPCRYRGAVVLVARGCLSKDTTEQFRDHVTGMLAMVQTLADGRPDLLVDLREVTFVDDLGVTGLRQCARRAQDLGGRLRLISGTALHRHLRGFGLGAVASLYLDLEAALHDHRAPTATPTGSPAAGQTSPPEPPEPREPRTPAPQ